MATVRALVLGGTSEASALARALDARPGVEVTTSFAGRTAAPVVAAGAARVGGFGGPSGLARYLREAAVDVLVDATHPFAARMRWHAVEASGLTGVPCLRVERPPWVPEDGDRWVPVGSLHEAAAAVSARGYRRALLTTGRTELAPFAACAGTWFLVRSVEPPDPMPLPSAETLLARGPFSVAGERRLLDDHRIEVVVSKNSGGDATVAKLVAARELGRPVVMVERPASPPGPRAASVDAALAWFDAVVARTTPTG